MPPTCSTSTRTRAAVAGAMDLCANRDRERGAVRRAFLDPLRPGGAARDAAAGSSASRRRGAMTIGTDLAVRTIAADGVVAANDAVLDAIAFSRGRFIVDGAEVVRGWSCRHRPEAARSIEDCRN